MALTPAQVSSTVLYRPGTTGSLVPDGFPWCASSVIGIDPTGLVLGLRVSPPSGNPVTVTGVPHISVAPAGSQCWQWPAAAASGPIFNSPTLMVQDSAHATWPMPCRSGFCLITAFAPTSSPFENACHLFGFFDSLTGDLLKPTNNIQLSGAITNLGTVSVPNLLLTVTTIGAASAFPIIVAVFSGGQ